MCCARAYTRILKVARTIADLSAVTLSGPRQARPALSSTLRLRPEGSLSKDAVEGAKSAGIKTEHVAEAIQYRTLDRDLWA